MLLYMDLVSTLHAEKDCYILFLTWNEFKLRVYTYCVVAFATLPIDVRIGSSSRDDLSIDNEPIISPLLVLHLTPTVLFPTFLFQPLSLLHVDLNPLDLHTLFPHKERGSLFLFLLYNSFDADDPGLSDAVEGVSMRLGDADDDLRSIRETALVHIHDDHMQCERLGRVKRVCGAVGRVAHGMRGDGRQIREIHGAVGEQRDERADMHGGWLGELRSSRATGAVIKQCARACCPLGGARGGARNHQRGSAMRTERAAMRGEALSRLEMRYSRDGNASHASRRA